VLVSLLAVETSPFDKNLFTFTKLLLGTLEVEVDVEAFQELCDWVLIVVLFLLQHLHQVLQNVSSSARFVVGRRSKKHCVSNLKTKLLCTFTWLPLVCDNGGGQITENVWARRLNGVQVSILEEQVDDSVSSVGVVEENEETPVDQPGALLQLVKR